MSRIAYVNGAYRRHADAAVSIDDRGYQFADAVYEVFAVLDGRLADETAHFDRLDRSLAALRIAAPMERAALGVMLRELVRRNRVRFGIAYLQIGRGVAPRAHPFPSAARASIVATARALDWNAVAGLAERGVAVVTVPETRWARRDIKSTGLLPNVLARQHAVEAGAYEAWFVEADGHITEGAATNAWIVDGDGRLITRPRSHDILHGVTRHGVAAVAREAGFTVIERAFTLAEAQAAREAFITSATSFVLPVTRIDGHILGEGRPGATATQLRRLYLHYLRAS